MNRIILAAQFARQAHKSQKRKHNGTPFIAHPARVAGRVATLEGATEDLVVAAYLHDVVEDTDCTIEQVQREFGTLSLTSSKS